MRPVSERAVLAGLLLAASLATLCFRSPPPAALLDPAVGPPTVLPDLARDGALRLSWLPGIGAGRAAALVRARPHLDGPLTVERLAELPGIGPRTQAAVQSWLQALETAGQPGRE